ncbi:MAG: aminotransferase class, partial [Acidimicrobiales bacterium]|nr:aminotransferase class [Acidimicrobiales bacterium]
MATSASRLARVDGAWRRFLVAGAVLSLVAALLPVDLGSLVGEIVGIVGVVLLWRGVRTHHAPHVVPFRLVAAGAGSILVGNLFRAAQGASTGEVNPFPSLGDPFFYLGYVVALAGIWSLVRHRSADIEGDNVLDTVIVALCIGAVVAATIVLPYASKEGVSSLERSITVGYNLFDLLMVAGIIRLAVGSGRRNTAYYLLGGGCAFTLLTDAIINVQGSNTGGLLEHLLPFPSTMIYVCLGACGLHPAVAFLTDRPAIRDIQLTGRRLTVLFAAVSLVAVQLLTALVWGGRGQILLATICTILVGFLALARLTLLVQANERKARRASLLREAAGELAAATQLDEMHQIAARVAASLLPEGAGWCLAGDESITQAGTLRDLEPVLERATALHAGSQVCSVDVGPGTPRVVVA